jgi:uncharacterized protein YbjT (DUF2867 family)
VAAALTSSDMPSILVTGARGNVGREVVTACLARGLPVLAGDRRASPGDTAARRFDFADRSTWAPALEGVDRVFLLRPPAVANVAETLNPFVDEAYRRGVTHVVFLSVQGAESRPRIPHYAVEQHLQQTGRAWTFLRPGFFAQNFQDAYRRDIVEDDRVYVPAGRGEVAFVDLRDVGEVAARVFEAPDAHKGAAYALTGQVLFTFFDAARILSEVTGRTIRYDPASALGYAWKLWRKQGLAPMHVLIQTYLHVGLRKGDAAIIDPALSGLIDHAPRTLETFLRDHGALFAR